MEPKAIDKFLLFTYTCLCGASYAFFSIRSKLVLTLLSLTALPLIIVLTIIFMFNNKFYNQVQRSIRGE